MKWKLVEQKLVRNKPTRIYRNEATGSECQTELLLTDDQNNNWWGFKDLRMIPYIRITYAKHISDLFSIGLSLKDIQDWCKQEKDLLRGKDPEKYEKLYALILEKERLANYTADPTKQHLALCTVYVLREDERIDHFSDEISAEKLQIWNADIGLLSFFLSWHNNHIQNFIKTLDRITPIVSRQQQQEQTKYLQQPGRS